MPPHSARPIPALGRHNLAEEFQVSVKYRLEIVVYDQERKFPYCRSGIFDTFGDHMQLPAMEWEMRFQGTIEFATI